MGYLRRGFSSKNRGAKLKIINFVPIFSYISHSHYLYILYLVASARRHTTYWARQPPFRPKQQITRQLRYLNFFNAPTSR